MVSGNEKQEGLEQHPPSAPRARWEFGDRHLCQGEVALLSAFSIFTWLGFPWKF